MVVIDEVEPPAGYAAVLIDVVGSREHADRAALRDRLAAAADAVNRRIVALDPLASTVGDELQGTYGRLLAAIRGVAELRLELTGFAEIRAGIGWGDIVIHDPERTPFGQDGPAWWSARAALDRVASSTARSGYEARLGIELGTTFSSPTRPAAVSDGSGALPAPRPFAVDLPALLGSHVALLDRALAAVDETEARIVLGDLAGRTTDELAAELGLTPSAVSQRRSRNHLRELVVALRVIDTAT